LFGAACHLRKRGLKARRESCCQKAKREEEEEREKKAKRPIPARDHSTAAAAAG
jgi:hypothetical protein